MTITIDLFWLAAGLSAALVAAMLYVIWGED